MYSFAALLLSAVLLAGCASPPGLSKLLPTGTPAGKCMLASLNPGEALGVDYRSRGCGGGSSFELLITMTAEGVRVTGTDTSPHLNKRKTKFIEHDRRPLLPVMLSASDAIKLDRVFEFYRQKHSGMCTTEDTIVLIRLTGGKAVATESFIDRSCGTCEQPDLLSLESLVWRMTPKR